MSNSAYGLVDWGTSSFRLWLTDARGQVIGESRSDEGMMACTISGFAPVLAKHLAALNARDDLPVVICGMAGARQGWQEAPYISLPTALDRLAEHALRVAGQTRDIRILPGLAQQQAHNANVMRGEETQLAGIAATLPDGLICMPGTHSKWTRLQQGAVTQFSTFMTGEVFAVLSEHSILKHAVDKDIGFDEKTPAFMRAVDKALHDLSDTWASIFSIRAAQLLGFEEKSDGAAHLSGLLIGAEIASAKQNYGAGNIGLVASGTLSQLYRSVLTQAGFNITLYDGETAVRQGLFQAAAKLWPQLENSNAKG